MNIKPVTDYSAVENLTTGLGSSVSKARQWVPKHSHGKRNKSRLRTLYHETVGGMIVDLIVDGVASGTPVGIADGDMGAYRSASKKLRQAWKLGRLYGHAWIDHLWGVHSTYQEVPGDDILYEFKGVECDQNRTSDRYESALVAPYSDICLYEACKSSAFETVGEFALISMQIPNMLESAKDCKFVDSMQSLSKVKAVTGLIVLSDGSKIELHHYNYDSLLKLMAAAEDAIATTAKIPKAILFQRSPSGATSGRFEIVRWYEQLLQESEVWIEGVNRLLSSIGVESRLTEMRYDHVLELYGLTTSQTA